MKQVEAPVAATGQSTARRASEVRHYTQFHGERQNVARELLTPVEQPVEDVGC